MLNQKESIDINISKVKVKKKLYQNQKERKGQEVDQDPIQEKHIKQIRLLEHIELIVQKKVIKHIIVNIKARCRDEVKEKKMNNKEINISMIYEFFIFAIFMKN